MRICVLAPGMLVEALLGGSLLPAPFNILPYSPCSLPFFSACSFLLIFTVIIIELQKIGGFAM